VTLPWVIAGAVAGLLAGPPIRAGVFAGSTSAGQPPRRECPACSSQVLPGRWRWRPVLPVTGRCPACQARIGPPLLVAELAAGGALAIVAARVSSGWELTALAWLTLIAVPLALIDVAVHRLPDRLTAPAFAGTLALLAVAALTAHQPDRLARAAIGGAALACFYLALYLLRPGQMGLGDAKIAATLGLVLGWTSWQALLTGTFAGFALAAIYGGVQMARNKATRTSQLPLGPFIFLGTLVALALLRRSSRRTTAADGHPVSPGGGRPPVAHQPGHRQGPESRQRPVAAAPANGMLAPVVAGVGNAAARADCTVSPPGALPCPRGRWLRVG
jgi:leader peptidase (prepilin peptidase) / N-methyltransferase